MDCPWEVSWAAIGNSTRYYEVGGLIRGENLEKK
jgi:hypothetical protein